ncbi:mediator of RNA polymerase II transcription subunit 1 [Trichonephila inaurata madagascariensis]|uniref:Mediator of RNA polymerase II transcription subunit 1 n=1 Tax=Trichonephila inaurata madagascariensis TaxID=2747483 RepID=A0A8X7CAL4_9ARAC|nr:mediator of RNA polymerase II transcription subunit 1 [Trichonephila inaurata madagascariensis]
MAAAESVSPDPVVSVVETPAPETTKESTLENLMEKLRAKAGQYRSWPEMSKSLRVAVTEKRHLMNSGDRTQLQKVLDTLQKSIKVTSLQSMVERLESISRQVQGVRFSNKSPSPELYLYNEMFYVEIILEPTGAVKDVKINHQADSAVIVTCPELVKVLKAGNFSEFTKHVEGLASIYQLNAEKKVKSDFGNNVDVSSTLRIQKTQAFLALQALETDLGMLAQLKSSMTEPRNLVHNSPVGILQKRRGGYSLKLTYFISPYDLLDGDTKTSIPLTAENVIEKDLGQSVTVCIESSTAHKLQTTSLITVTKTTDGRSQPQFAALSNLNSTILPANFVLKLPKPIPMAISLVKDIQNVTNAKIPDCGDLSNAQPLLSVIINDSSNGKLSAGDQGLWVTLPDQHHCYFLNSSPDLQGVMVSSIPFTHPTHVPQILVFLRQQMLFNTVISSCIRPGSKIDAESPFMFESMAYSTSHIIVSFEHPLEESLATVDIDLKDINKVSCKIYTLSSDASMCTDDYASKVMQRCLSIPITMRAVIRKAHGQQQLMRSSNQGDSYCATVNSSGSVPYLSHIPNYENSLTNGSSFSGGDFSNLASRMCNKPCDANNAGKLAKNASSSQNSESQSFVHSNSENSSFNAHDLETDASASNPANNSDNYTSGNEKSKNSLSNSQNKNSNSSNQYQHNKRHANTMLMSMLSDVPAANASSSSFPFIGHSDNSCSGSNAGGKSRKRKKRSDNRSPSASTGRSPKRKLSEDDYIRDRSTPDGEICDSPLAYEACSSLPASLPSSSVEQHMTHTPGSVESLIKTEQQSPVGFPQRSASTDSYLMHEEFQSRHGLNVNDSSHMSEGGNSNNSEMIRNFSQIKNQYFGSDNMLEMKGYLSTSEATNYPDSAAVNSDIDMEDDNSFSMDSNPGNNLTTKSNSSERPAKKKKYKEKSENVSENIDLSVVKHENISSDESSIGEMSQKSFSEAENSQSEDSSTSSKSNISHLSQQIFLGTSLKIAKSGDGHKVSKSEPKLKQKDSKRTSGIDSSESSGKKKSDAKKEKKRRKAESSGNISSRSPVRPLHLNIDSSLMPPPSSSSETSMMISSSDTQPIRPITLNVKASPIVSSNSSFQAKSPVYSKKSSSLSNTSSNVSKSSSSKNSSSEKAVKPSPPRSSHFPSIKVSSSESDSKRSSGPTTVKIQSKHKQSSSSKSNSSSGGSTHSGGRSSPSKVKSATLKFKNYPVPSSVTLTPIVTKVTSSPASMSVLPSPDSLVMQTSVLNPSSPTGKSSSSNSKANKSVVRSRSLNAVIDKLKVSASNAQYSIPDGLDNVKCEGGMRSESMVERKDSKLERKDNCKESRDTLNLSKGSESKSKYSSSEQFTVKQSSQGIKLTVTKTRSGDGSSKSSKSKQSTKSSSAVTSSSSSSVGKATSSSGSSNTSKSGNASPASKKIYSSSSNVSGSTKVTTSGSNQLKQNPTSSQKISSPSSASAMSPRTGNSANNLSKSISKHISSSSQNKVSGSNKVFDKSDKKSISDLKTVSSEIKDSITTSSVNMVTSLMPPPTLSKSVGDSSRSSSSGNTPKRIEESSRQSPRHTPTRDASLEELDNERAFRILLNQTKNESANGSDQSNLTCRSSQMIQAPVDYSKDFSKIEMIKSELEDKGQWVSSSSDVKASALLCSSLKHNQDQVILDDTNCMPMNDLECKLNMQIEVSSSKHDSIVNANVVSSSEEVNKSIAPQLKPIKQSKRPTGPCEEDSSPDECLVIDCDNDDKWSSPCLETNIVLNVLDDKLEKSEMSPSTFALNQSSLIKSPAQLLSSSNHSLTRPITYAIDDDLMNEAVMPIEK